MQDSFALTGGELMFHPWYVLHGMPEYVLRTPDGDSARELLQRIGVFRAHEEQRRRIATDAIVTAISEDPPAGSELDEAAADLRLETIGTLPDSEIVLHFQDSCGSHFISGRWPAARFATSGEVRVTVEAQCGL